jgi:hypothetical protein
MAKYALVCNISSFINDFCNKYGDTIWRYTFKFRLPSYKRSLGFKICYHSQKRKNCIGLTTKINGENTNTKKGIKTEIFTARDILDNLENGCLAWYWKISGRTERAGM